MIRTLDRYIFKEAFQTWAAVTGVLLFILISNQFARILGDAAAGKLPKDAVLALLGLTSLNYLTILIPVGLFISTMLTLGRLYQDSEMAALTACGVGPRQLYRPLLLAALPLVLLLTALALELAPWALRQVHEIRETAKQETNLRALEPGRFTSAGNTGVVFYAERVGVDGKLQNVFLHRRNGAAVEVAVAAAGEQLTDTARGIRVLALYDGRRYEGVPGTANFRVTEFAEHGIPIQRSRAELGSDKREIVSTSELWGSALPADKAELHWRIAAPLSALILVLLALPLAKTSPRQGRFGKLALGVLVYIIYSNLLGVARVWLEAGTLPAALGMWWVHALVLLLTLALVWRHYGLGSLLAPAQRRLHPKDNQ